MLSRTLKRQASKEEETVAVHRPKYLRGLSPHTGKAATPSRMTQKADLEDASATPVANSVETPGGGLPVAAQTVLPLPILIDVPPPEVVGVTQSRDSENEQIRILLERQREQILADCRAEIQKHEFQADYDRRSIPKLNGVIESQRGEINRALEGDEQLRRDQQLLHEQLLKQNCDLREAHEKSLNEMEELKKFHCSTFDTITRRRLVEDHDTILELTGKIQELQNEINCMNDSRDFQDAESVRSGHSHVTSQPVSFPHHPDPGGMPSRSLGMPSRNDGPPSIWDTHGTSGNVFANPMVSSPAPYPQESNPWVARGMGPQGMPKTGGGGLAKGPELACVQTPIDSGWHLQGEKDELTSCRGTV